jgi:hypothetical protein
MEKIIPPPRLAIDAFASEFRRYRLLAEGAAGQLTWEQLRISLDPQTNSSAVMMKHVGGNLRSRWTEPFTSDGEKPWRDRDSEFIDRFTARGELDAIWQDGWKCIHAVLDGATDSDLARIVRIRGEQLSFAAALSRSLSHIAYHAGQIVQAARIIASREGITWTTLTVPRGGSVAYNKGLGFDPGNGPAPR